MAPEEFQVEACDGIRWNSPRNLFGPSSPWSSSIPEITNFGWPNCHELITDVKNTAAGSSDDSAADTSVSDGRSAVDAYKTLQLAVSGDTESACGWINNPHDGGNYSQNGSHMNSSLNNFSQLDFYTNSFKTAGINQQDSSLQTLFSEDSAAGRLNHEIDYFSLTNNNPPHNFHYFTHNTNFWNAQSNLLNPSTTASQFLPSTLLNNREKPHKEEDELMVSVAKKSISCKEAAATLKRPRTETPSPLPTFKVRKEKLGDRITALQQLVSPFGKTDTASVLHEAIDYIKFLHDQVNALTTPYLKNGVHPRQRRQQVISDDKVLKDDQGLIGRGLCLVPISITFPVAAETASDFWTPSFAGNFR